MRGNGEWSFGIFAMKLEGDVHVSGTMRAAWFKDPDGNILAVVNAG